MLSENWYLISCRRCRKDMGYVDSDELRAIIIDCPDGPICFTCEPDQPARFLPDILNNIMSKGDLILDNGQEVDIFDVRLPEDGPGFSLVELHHIFACTHDEWERARGLSSSTYLNKDVLFLEIPTWILEPKIALFACDFCGRLCLSEYTSSTPPHQTVACCDDCFEFEKVGFDVYSK